MLALARALQMMSFSRKCLADLAALVLQLSPWIPQLSTCSPQVHVWLEQRCNLNRRPTAMRMKSLSSRKPKADIIVGIAFNQSHYISVWRKLNQNQNTFMTNYKFVKHSRLKYQYRLSPSVPFESTLGIRSFPYTA